MKSSLKKLYFWLMRPLYDRLSRELVLQSQRSNDALVKYEEGFTRSYGNELVRLNMKIQEVETRLADSLETLPGLSSGTADAKHIDRHVAEIVQGLEKCGDVLEISRTYDVPVSEVLHYERKYRGMSSFGIQRAKKLEKENAQLRQMVEKLITEQENHRDNEPSLV